MPRNKEPDLDRGGGGAMDAAERHEIRNLTWIGAAAGDRRPVPSRAVRGFTSPWPFFFALPRIKRGLGEGLDSSRPHRRAPLPTGQVP